MHLSLSLNTALTQTLTPQQVQYLKLLQLTNLQLEQYLQQEIEANPMLEEVDEQEHVAERELLMASGDEQPLTLMESASSSPDDDGVADVKTMDDFDPSDATNPDDNTWQDYIDDDEYKSPRATDDDDEPFPVRATTSFVDELLEQLFLCNITAEEKLLGRNIVWNIEPSGYLERELSEILDETNEAIREHNFELLRPFAQAAPAATMQNGGETAMQPYAFAAEPVSGYAHSDAVPAITNGHSVPMPFDTHGAESYDTLHDFAHAHNLRLLIPVTLQQAEKVLKQIQMLEPPGIGARDLRECLLAQLDVLPRLNAAQKLAREVLIRCYDSFRMKHFDVMMRTLKVTEQYLREAFDVIRVLNPKPGGGELSLATHSVIPDFFIEYDEEKNDFLVRLNDSRLPALHINKEYEKVRREARRNKFNKDTREWLRKKHDDAKFLIQAMNQRRDTMRKVITALVHRQQEFFRYGENYMKPLIYRDIADDTGLDISTVCRVVNGKYAQTDYGVFELRYFFSESLESDEGEEISTKVIKNKLKEMIDGEKKSKPLSDDKLAKEMKALGYNVARRTVAKYREQMRIPVARLRKEL